MQTSYLNVDMGLFLKFDTDKLTGRPNGCSGLSNPRWLGNQIRESDVPHGCPLNQARDDNGDKMHEIVELFARNSQLWINEFMVVFQKMQENGYKAGDLSCEWKYSTTNQWPQPC